MRDRTVLSRCRFDRRFRWLVGCLLLTGSTVDARGIQKPEAPVAVFARPLGTPAVVRWQARTLAPGARFRLFRGAAGGPLGLIAEIEAKDGVQSYQVRDDAATGSNQVYELRVVSREGHEELLRRISCRRFDAATPLEPSFGSSPRSGGAWLSQVPAPPVPAAGRFDFLRCAPDPLARHRPEPLFPPPREASAPVA